jgi:hypothetical protein
MKFRPVILPALAGCLLSSCLFTEPVFEKGFGKTDPSLAGVWATNDKPKDPRKTEFVVCTEMSDRLMIHYPAGPGSDGGGIYYEARSVSLHGRRLLQLRLMATFKEGLPSPSDKSWTLLWLEPKGKDTMMVRSLKGEEGINPDPATVRRALEGSAEDWESRFGEPQKFERLHPPEEN